MNHTQTVPFALCSDPQRMQAVFQHRLPGFAHGSLEITGCAILDLRYKTYRKPASHGKSFLAAAYRLAVSKPGADYSTTHIVYVKAYAEQRGRLEWERVLNGRLYSLALGMALVYLPELGMLVWSFPNDPALPALAEVIDPQRVLRHLPYAELMPGAKSDDVDGVRIEVINYRPEIRCTARYTVNWRLHGRLRSETIYGKTYSDDSGRAIGRLMDELGQRCGEDEAAFIRPHVIGYTAASQTLWLAALRGVPLIDHLERHNHRRLAEAVVAGIACFHNGDPAGLNRVSLDEHLAETHKKAAKLAQAFPSLRDTLAQIVRRLAADLPYMQAGPERLIHGDFHLGQLVMCEERLGLLDYDETACGDPLQDLAQFFADLYNQPIAPGLIRSIVTTFVRTYRERAAWDVSAERLDWHIADQAIARAYRAYVQQKPDLERVMRQFIALARDGIAKEPTIV